MIEQRIEICRPREYVFALSQDYGERLKWDPFPESYKFVNGSIVENGLRIYVKAKNGLSMIVEYVSYKPPQVAAIKLIEGPWFISEFAGSWSFKEVSSASCTVIFKYHVNGRPRMLNFIIKPLLEFAFNRNAKKRLVALKKYAEEQI